MGQITYSIFFLYNTIGFSKFPKVQYIFTWIPVPINRSPTF